jgi:hypothetical protein
VLIGGLFYGLAQGRNGNLYGLILSIAGVTYLVALSVLRWRSAVEG